MVRKAQTIREIAVSATVEENRPFEILRANLAKVANRKDVLGYILRTATSAIIDLKDSAKIVEYAILSSQALDSGKELSALFDLGTTDNIIIVGKDAKVLCLVADENKAAIFVEKGADYDEILRQVTP